MHNLTAIATFRKVAETRNITTAAQQLRMTPSAVSRQVTRLENNLGTQLLIRTTRHLRLTKIGEEFYKRCSQGLTELDDAVRIASLLREEPHGLLRIGTTPFFGKFHLVPTVMEFLAKFPRVSVDVSMGNLEPSFHESGVDILVRAGMVRGKSIVHENLAPIRHVICAAPEYLRKHGTPREPKDLLQHNCLLSSRPAMYEWPFIRGHRREYIPVSGNFQTDNVEALYQAVMCGAGIARLSNYVVGPELRSGRLRALFGGVPKNSRQKSAYSSTTNTMKAYYLKSRYPDQATRAFIQMLKARFEADYNWERRNVLP